MEMDREQSVGQLRCPECDGLVHIRRFPLCEYCKSPLPKAFGLTEGEKKEAEQLREENRLLKEKESWSFLYDRDASSGCE